MNSEIIERFKNYWINGNPHGKDQCEIWNVKISKTTKTI